MDHRYSLNIDNYKALFNHSPLGIFTATTEGRYIEVNTTLASMLGYDSPDELISNISNISTEIYANSGERESILKELKKSKSISTHETKFLKKDGNTLSVRIHLNLINEGETENLVVGMVQDITSQLSTQQAILHEKQTLLTLIENLPDYIYFKDTKGNFLIANKAVRNLFESAGKGKLKKKTQNTIEELFENDDTILQDGSIFSDKLIEIYHDNIKCFISVSKYPLFDNNNKITGLITIGRNLTDLKQAEIKIIESQANLQALFESTNDFIWSVDADFKLLTFNSSLSAFVQTNFGRTLNPGDKTIDILPSVEKDFWKQCYKQTAKGEKVYSSCTIHVNKHVYYYECAFNPIFNKSHTLGGISVILTDVTTRKRTEQAIAENEERFRQLAENTSDAFVLWDDKGILYANPGFEKIFGISIDKAKNDLSVIEKLIAEEDRQRYTRNRTKELTGKHKPRNQQYLLRKNRRVPRLIWSRHFPVHNAKGKVYRYVSVTSDLTEQKQLEEVLTETRSQQQALLDNIPFLAWLKDKNGKYISVNHPFADYYNLAPEEIIGKTDFDLLPQKLATELLEVDMDVITSGEKKHIEDVRKTAHGKEWIEVYKSPIFNDKGEVTGLTGISRDITDRKRLEEAILKNEEHFRALLQHSSDAITILDEDGIITFESSLRNRILNFTVEELVGKPFHEIIHPEDVAIYKSVFKEVVSTPGIQVKKEFRSLHKNKKWIYVESIFSNHLHNPSISGIVVNTRDISDRKMSELKEKAYNNNLIFLSNSALELLSLSNRENIFRFIGEKLKNFLVQAVIIVSSYEEESDSFEINEVVGHDGIQKGIEAIFGRSAEGFTFKRNKKYSRLDNAGSIITIPDLSNLPVDNPEFLHNAKEAFDFFNVNKLYNISLARNQKLLGNITILTLNKSIIKFKHIIETFAHQVAVALHRSQLEHELVSAKVKAEESDRLKTAFLANMSHEIRTPMNGILGFAEMLNDHQLPVDERKKYIDIINTNGKILINLIDDIIDFAKIEAGQLKVLKHEFSLNKLLGQIHSSFLNDSFQKEKSSVKLKIRKGFIDEESYIKTDPNRLRQILINLVGNSIKFTNEGFIEFGYKLRNDNYLEFYVKDTGIGIKPEKLGMVFERFVQADSSRSRKYSGSGLGLAISKGFIDLLGGKMWAESVIGEGSVFYFTVPYEAAKRRVKEKEETKNPKSDYNWSDKTFLVAEDDFFSYKFLEGFLKQTKATIMHAEDGKKAVDICKENQQIDMVLMDVQMPEMNGIDATRTIKGFNKSLPIIAQTANAITEEKQRCFEAGFDDFVTKPVNISELFMKIEKWLKPN